MTMTPGNGETATKPFVSKYKDNSAGQREGAIGHYASRITSALIASGHVQSIEEAIKTFKQLKVGIEENF